MGFYSLSNILYNLRKISKYILLSFCLLSFIIVCLLLMSSKVNAANDSIVYRAKRGYGDESSLYTDKFNVTYTLTPNGNTASIKVNGTMGTQSNPYEVQSMDYTYSFNFYDTDYDYIPFVYHDYNVRYIMYFKVPHNSTYYAFNYGINNSYTSFFCGFYCDQAYEVYEKNTRVSSKAAGSIYHSTLIGAYPLCLTYDKVTKDNVIFNPFNEFVYNPPTFLNYDDSTTYGNTLINGEFYNFDFKVYGDESDFVFLHDITEGQPTDIFSSNGINSSMINLKEYYISLDGQISYRYLKNIDNNIYYYSVPVTSFFGRYKNNTDYLLVLSYPSGSKQYTWTTSFSSSGITIQEENINTQIENSINNLNQSQQDINNFLLDNNYSSSNVLDNMPSSDSYTSPTDSGINSIFTSLYNAFTNPEPTTVRFVIPFTNGQYIDIASDIVTSRLDSTILTLIQMFYWFMIARFIIKDIATYAQKAKSGAILDNNGDDNIKTDLL